MENLKTTLTIKHKEVSHKKWLIVFALVWISFFAGGELSWGEDFGISGPVVLGNELKSLHNWSFNILLGSFDVWGGIIIAALAILCIVIFLALLAPLPLPRQLF